MRETGQSLAFAIAWIIACALAWFASGRLRSPQRVPPVLVVMITAAVTRVVPALALDRGLMFDVDAHWRVGLVALAGADVYAAPLTQGRFPYPPLPLLLDALMVRAAGHDYARFLVVDKLVPAACGVALSAVVWALARRAGGAPSRAMAVGLLYALNPLPILVTAYHGQVEEIPLLGVALALLLLGGSAPVRSRQRVVASALALGLAIAYKTWPLLFLAPLALLVRAPNGVRVVGGWRADLPRGAAYIVMATAPLAATILGYGLIVGPNLQGAREALSAMASYRGPAAFCWGYLGIVDRCWAAYPSLTTWAHTLSTGLLPVALLMAVVATRRRPLLGLATLPLVFYLLTPGWGPNYSIWALPFLALRSARLARWYTIGVLPAVAATYLDVLYAYPDPTFPGRTLLRPIEAALGVVAWVTVAATLVALQRANNVSPSTPHRVRETRTRPTNRSS